MILKGKYKEMLLNIAGQNVQTPINIWAFGSRVNGDVCNGSDLDLVIKTKDGEPLNIDELADFRDSLCNSNIPFLIDVLDWGRIPNHFKDNINQKYEVLK